MSDSFKEGEVVIIRTSNGVHTTNKIKSVNDDMVTLCHPLAYGGDRIHINEKTYDSISMGKIYYELIKLHDHNGCL